MKQPIKKTSITPKKKKPLQKRQIKKSKHHPQYGTSKLEEDFAKEFLEKLGVEYQYQFEAKDIGRFYDFYLPKVHLLIEIDGDYWHGNPELYTEEKLKYHQKRAQSIDDIKDKWALMHSIPIMRIWEHDIRKNPKEVMKRLKERLYIEDKKVLMEENKNKRHTNKLKKKK